MPTEIPWHTEHCVKDYNCHRDCPVALVWYEYLQLQKRNSILHAQVGHWQKEAELWTDLAQKYRAIAREAAE